MPIRLRGLLHLQEPEIEIKVNRPERTFTSLDRLDGVVRITVPVDTAFSDVNIQFVGTTMSYIEGFTTAVNVSGKRAAFHTFLKLSQPGQHLFFPDDQVLRAGQLYDFPFVFIVPNQLLPQVCQHQVSDPAVRDAHMQLPPSMGDKDLGRLLDLPDDFAPENASVRYGIFCRLLKCPSHTDPSKPSILAAKAKRVRIVPAFDEQPPGFSCDPGEHVFRKECKVKSGLLQGTSGTLVIEADEPPSLRLQSPNAERKGRVSTWATIKLRFNPMDENVLPPRIRHVATTLEVVTFFTSTAYRNFPLKSVVRNDTNHGLHSTTRTLSRHSIGHVEWLRQNKSCEDALGYSGPPLVAQDDIFNANQEANTRSYFTTEVPVPIILPSDQTFVPSFRSCFLSRAYSLGLRLSMVGGGMTSNKLELKVPIQIVVDGDKGSQLPAVSTYERCSTILDAGSCITVFPLCEDGSSGVGYDDHGNFGPDLDEPPCYIR